MTTRSRPRLRWPPDGQADVWFLKVSTVDRSALAAAEVVLSEEETARAAAFRFAADATRYRAAHVGLRLLLGGYLAVPPADLSLIARACAHCGGPHGKPTLGHLGRDFSLSHSRDIVAFAFATSPVGVDVEAKGAYSDLAGLLHLREQRSLHGVPATRAADAVVQCWVRKEAYLKGTGAGLGGGVAGVFVGLGSEFGDTCSDSELGGWTLTDLAAPEGYAAAVATSGPATVTVRPVPPSLITAPSHDRS